MIEFSPEQRIAAARLFNISQPFQEKIRSKHPEAIFRINDLFQLNVFTEESLQEAELDELMDEQLELTDKEGIMLHILPGKFEDYEASTFGPLKPVLTQTKRVYSQSGPRSYE